MKTILLVEDNESDEFLTVRTLRKHNVVNEVIVVRDGEEALDWLFGTGVHGSRDATELPTVVLLDLNLPKIGGLDVLRRIRAEPRFVRLPVVVLTSSNEDEDVITSYDLGANAYVRKPVEFDRFAEAVRTLGMFWGLFNELPPRAS
jgi:two-component system response regulator